MTTSKQIAANQRNARKSSGPRTTAGKAVSRMNSVRHGLTASTLLLPGEDPSALEELRQGILSELESAGELEAHLANHVVGILWRLGRLLEVESGMFGWELYGELAERAEKEAQSYCRTLTDDILATYDAVVDEEGHEQALGRVKQATENRHSESILLGRAFSRDAFGADGFTKLARYQASLERSLFRTLREIRELRRLRTTAT